MPLLTFNLSELNMTLLRFIQGASRAKSPVLNALAFGVLALSLAATPAQAQLVDGQFEFNPLTTIGAVLSNPFLPGQWGQESSTITGPIAGIAPYNGSKMLRMTDSGDVVTQTAQAINVSAFSSTINGPGMNFFLSAYFNSANRDNIGGMAMQFFSGNNLSTQILPFVSNIINVDAAPNTWERLAIGGLVPIGTTWMLAQVFYVNASFADPTVVQAGFVDGVEFGLRPLPVPEPSTYAMLGLGLVGVALVKRRAPGSASSSTPKH
jgi:PEP-CTERM motif